jgi:hypothetical protein
MWRRRKGIYRSKPKVIVKKAEEHTGCFRRI